MQENTINKNMDAILSKKTEGYGTAHLKNFTAAGEITVEITLEEYRDLVEKNATRQYAIDQANDGKYQREQEINQKTKEIETLKAENYELKKSAEEAKKDADAWKKAYYELKEVCDGIEADYEDKMKRLREEAATWEREYCEMSKKADKLAEESKGNREYYELTEKQLNEALGKVADLEDELAKRAAPNEEPKNTPPQ